MTYGLSQPAGVFILQEVLYIIEDYIETFHIFGVLVGDMVPFFTVLATASTNRKETWGERNLDDFIW